MTLVFTPIQSTLFSLPHGFVLRPAQMEDADAVTEMLNAHSRFLLDIEKYKVKDILTDWTMPAFDLQNCTRVVISPDGKLVGYAELWDLVEPYVKKFLWARVHPAYLDLGIGMALDAWGEEQSRNWIDKAPQDARVVFHVSTNILDQNAVKLFESLDFHHIRTFWRMVIELTDEPSAPVLPDGMVIRPIIRGKEEPVAIGAIHESFLDHWGFMHEPFDTYLERWLYYINHNEDYDPDLWFMAFDSADPSGEQVAGASLCYKKSFDDPNLGWVGSLGVRRPWRKRGLGLALLQHSFIQLYRRGQRRIGLGVDASSLTGATRLYEKAGMHVDQRFTMNLYEKELRPGKDLLIHSL